MVTVESGRIAASESWGNAMRVMVAGSLSGEGRSVRVMVAGLGLCWACISWGCGQGADKLQDLLGADGARAGDLADGSGEGCCQADITDRREEGRQDLSQELRNGDSSGDVAVLPMPSGPAIPADFMAMCPLDSEPKAEHWDRLQEWGVRVSRQGFFWEWITAADGSFDFSWPDRYFEEAEKRGIAVLVTFSYDSPLIHQEGDARPSVPESAHDAWLAYVTAVTNRYKDRAWGFEVWNEPNHPTFWKGTREEFVALAKVTVDKVRELAPGVPVAVAGFSLLPEHWLDALHAAGVVDAADAISFHPYWIDGDGAVDMVRQCRKWMAKNGIEKPMWITEYGWPSGGDYPTATTLEDQAERLVRFLPGAALEQVRAAWWYASLDWKDPEDIEDPDASEGVFGLAWPTSGDKPVALAYRVLAAHLPGSVPDLAVAERLAAAGGLRPRAFLKADGTLLLVLTNDTSTAAVLRVPASATVAWSHPLGEGDVVGGELEVEAGHSVILLGPRAFALELSYQ